jgi:ATP-dependent Lon protease
VIIPDDNRKDLADIPANVTDSLEIRPVKWIDEVLDLALERPLAPARRDAVAAEGAADAAKADAPKDGSDAVRPH